MSTKHHNIIRPDGTEFTGKVVKCKTADQTVNNSETLVNDDTIFFPLLNGEQWQFLIVLYGSIGTNTPDIDLRLAATDSLTGTIKYEERSGGTNRTYSDDFTTEMHVPVSATPRSVIIDGTVTATANGTLQLQWAQNAATVENTLVMSHSYLRAERVS